MGRRRSWIAVAALGAVFAVHVNGCSLIGLTAGAMLDADKPRYQQLRGSEMVRVLPGSHVQLLLDDSTWVVGIYRGSARIADDEYRPVYDAWGAHHPRGASFPQIGEPVDWPPMG